MGRGQAAKRRVRGRPLELRDRGVDVAGAERGEPEDACGCSAGVGRLRCRAAAEGVDERVAGEGRCALTTLADLVGEAGGLEEVERRVRPASGLEVQPGGLEQGPRQHDDGMRARRGRQLFEELAEEGIVAGTDAGKRLDCSEDQLRIVAELPVRRERRSRVREAFVSRRGLAGLEQRARQHEGCEQIGRIAGSGCQ